MQIPQRLRGGMHAEKPQRRVPSYGIFARLGADRGKVENFPSLPALGLLKKRPSPRMQVYVTAMLYQRLK
jgi:hypothetical protein